MQPALSLW